MRRIMLAMAVLAMVGCSKESGQNVTAGLPTVSNQAAPAPESQGTFIECHPDHGHGPTKFIHFPEDGTKNNVCFREGVCFYGCSE